MKKPILPCVVVAMLLFQGCNYSGSFFGGPRIKGSGVMKTETREVQSFDGIQLQISADVEIKKGDAPKLVITADDNLLPIITTEVSGGTLKIAASQSYSTSRKMKLELQAPVIRAVEVAGSGDVHLDSVTKDEVKLTISGSGDIKAIGAVESIEVAINGSGDMDLRELKAEQAKVTINGSGKAQVFASESVDARINGSGDIDYYGEPSRIQTKVNGSGDIARR